MCQSAFEENNKTCVENGIPNWSNSQWREYFDQKFHHFGNVMVTYDDFYNKFHTDECDVNTFAYGLFSYIDKRTGKPIPPPSQELGHGLLFRDHACIVDFAHSFGIVEILWKTSEFTHQTTKPP